MFELCPPALIYLVFSLTQIIIDLFKGLYNTAFFKAVVMIMVTILLNALCQSGLTIVSWVIVFVPFIFMTVIVSLLLYIFGLDIASGTISYKCNQTATPTTTTTSAKSTTTQIHSPVEIFNPNYNANAYPILPATTTTTPTPAQVNNYNNVQSGSLLVLPNYSSTPLF
jgi:hypothetical protein